MVDESESETMDCLLLSPHFQEPQDAEKAKHAGKMLQMAGSLGSGALPGAKERPCRRRRCR